MLIGLTQYFNSLLEETFAALNYDPKYLWHIVLVNLPANIEAYMDFEKKQIGIAQTLKLRIEKHRTLIDHEAVHVIQAEEDPERYLHMKYIQGSAAFRLIFHDTLLNCLEVEARIYAHCKTLVRYPTRMLWRYLEWMISNPVQAMKLFQLHPEWGYLRAHKALQVNAWVPYCLDDIANVQPAPEVVSLSAISEELWQILRETVGDDILRFLFL